MLRLRSILSNNLARGSEVAGDVNAVEEGTHRTPLHYAAENANLEMCIVLLQRFADLNAQDVKGDSPLLLVSRAYQVGSVPADKALTFVRMVIKEGANPHIQNLAGESAYSISLRSPKLLAVIALSISSYLS